MDDEHFEWGKLDWGKAIELALCAVAFLLGFAKVPVIISAAGLAVGFGARHAERWPKRLAYLQDDRRAKALVLSVLVALAFDGVGSSILYGLGYGLSLLVM